MNLSNQAGNISTVISIFVAVIIGIAFGAWAYNQGSHYDEYLLADEVATVTDKFEILHKEDLGPITIITFYDKNTGVKYMYAYAAGRSGGELGPVYDKEGNIEIYEGK